MAVNQDVPSTGSRLVCTATASGIGRADPLGAGPEIAVYWTGYIDGRPLGERAADEVLEELTESLIGAVRTDHVGQNAIRGSRG
jgi:hypothetical protein